MRSSKSGFQGTHRWHKGLIFRRGQWPEAAGNFLHYESELPPMPLSSELRDYRVLELERS
jgi:hypothetical protein